jgi:hypothetical protein
LLDVLTPKGQLSVQQERDAVAMFTSRNPAYQYVDTPKHLPADIDAMLLHKGQMHSLVETKCRDCSLDQFMGAFGGEWLVTFDKVVKARDLARAMGVGLTGFLYLTRDKVLLAQRITDETGLLIPRMRVESTQTQRTTNGGQIVRTNAYIDMRAAKVIRSYDATKV